MRYKSLKSSSVAKSRLALRTIRLDLGFIGTRYEGFQSQHSKNTIQDTLERALAKVFHGGRTVVHGCSRTDSGVHAKRYIAHFEAAGKITDEKLINALNYHLPDDIVIHSAKTMHDDFHSRFDTRSKVYRYQIWQSRARPLFEAPYSLWCPGSLDISAMQKAARHLIGKHDFRAFKDSGDEKKNTVRHLTRLTVAKKGPLVCITAEADGFLTHMVRVIAGTLLEVGRGRLKPSEIPNILHSKNRHLAGPTVKSLGLCLIKVNYS